MVKLYIYLIVVLLCSSDVYGQNVGINKDNATPDASAMLDVNSPNQGLLIPRVTLAGTDDVTTIPTPAISLLIFNTGTTSGTTAVKPGYYYWDGFVWERVSVATDGPQAHYVGESYGGGIVFYIYDHGQHGLIAAAADQSIASWFGFNGVNIKTWATADGVNAGLKNTTIIIATQGPSAVNEFAAAVCNEYTVTFDGVMYGDWYLPSKYELNILYSQKSIVGGFNDLFPFPYWSSTEIDDQHAWAQSFVTGNAIGSNRKLTPMKVRAIRAF